MRKRPSVCFPLQLNISQANAVLHGLFRDGMSGGNIIHEMRHISILPDPIHTHQGKIHFHKTALIEWAPEYVLSLQMN
jgi:hypothetical protein